MDQHDDPLTALDQQTKQEPRDSDGQVRQCLNCEALLTGPYCSACGQKDIPKRQSLNELVSNFLSSFSGYESKFFITAKYLLLKPGFLATEFNKGKRERYFHPARLYVFISFIYFFLLTWIPPKESESLINVKSDTTTVDYFKSEKSKVLTRAQYDSLQATLPAGERDGWLVRKWQYKQLALEQQFYSNPMDFAKRVIADFTAHFSQVFFLLLPAFAFILWLLYRKHDFFYSEHLVFSICYYNFFFVAGSVSMLADAVSWLTWIALLADLSIFVYLLVAMKRTYRQSMGKTLLKYSLFVILFGICVVFGLLINLFVTLMMI
jgi:hypothetical protein